MAKASLAIFYLTEFPLRSNRAFFSSSQRLLPRSFFSFSSLPTMADNADWRARPAGNAPKAGGTRWSSGGSGGGLGKGGKSSSKRGGKKKYVS